MPDPWLEGAYRDPGVNAGYNAGHNQMVRAVAHYTVGQDSRSVGRNGYFHFLVHKDASRENGCTQYAEVDAMTWHAADAGNPYGPGVEWERMTTDGVNDEGLSNADPLTENQLEWGERIIAFLAEWGIPVQLYDGPRYAYGDWNGWINHMAIDSARSDGLRRAEWDYMCGGGGPEPVAAPEDDDMFVAVYNGPDHTKTGLWLFDGTVIAHYPSVNMLSPGRTFFTNNWDDLLWWVDRINEARAAIGVDYQYDFGR